MPLILFVFSVWLASVALPSDDAAGANLCAASWTLADKDSDGVLEGTEATAWLAMMYLHKETPPEDGRIDRTRFVDACLAGTFRTGYTPGR